MIQERISTAADASPSSEIVVAYDAIRHLAAFYPDFDVWYWETVVPGIVQGSRKLETVFRNGNVVGVSISKRDDHELKICTVWVADDFKKTGLGIRLIKQACRWLGTDRPLATVPEERIGEFATVLRKLGFIETEAVSGLYRAGHVEHVFNGRMSRLAS